MPTPKKMGLVIYDSKGRGYDEEEIASILAELESRATNPPTAAPAVRRKPVAAQYRFRHPQRLAQNWSVWQPASITLDRPSWEIDSQGYEVEYRLLYDAPQPEEQQPAPDVKDLRKLLWAAAMTAGGKLVIEDKHIHRVNDECRLHRYDDTGLRRVVFTAQCEAH